MSDILPIVSNLRRLQAALKDLSSDDVVDIRDKFNVLIDKKVAEEEKEKMQNAAKHQAVDEIRKKMADAGIDADELFGNSAAKPARKSRGERKPNKYRVVIDGQEHLWSGLGRRPKVFVELVEQGKSLDDYLIGSAE